MNSIGVDVECDLELLPRDAAQWFLCWLETNGAIVTLNAQQGLHVDLNGIAGLDFENADRLSRQALWLREELRTLLIDRQATRH
jgi:hypothetical protein